MAEGGLHRKTEETDTCLCLSPRLDSHGDWSQATCGSACQSPCLRGALPGRRTPDPPGSVPGRQLTGGLAPAPDTTTSFQDQSGGPGSGNKTHVTIKAETPKL